MVIFDVTTVIILGHHELHPYTMANLTDNCVCSDFSTDWPFLHLTPSPSASLISTLLKLGQLITLQWPLSVQVKRRVACLLL